MGRINDLTSEQRALVLLLRQNLSIHIDRHIGLKTKILKTTVQRRLIKGFDCKNKEKRRAKELLSRLP